MSLPTPTLPTTSGAYALSAGGFSVTLPTTVNSTTDEIKTTSYLESIEGRRGLFPIREPDYQGRGIELSGYIYDSSTVQSLKRVLSYGRVLMTRSSLQMFFDVESASIVERVTGVIWQVILSFRSYDPFWEEASDTTTSSSPTSVSNAGDADAYPVFTVTAGVGGMTAASFTIDGRVAAWTGSASEGNVLIIDCNNLNVSLEGSGALNSMNASFFTNPPRLKPGSNTITPSITGAATYVVAHRELFL